MRYSVSGKAELVVLWSDICANYDKSNAEWVEKLRAAGFKAAHPNDGWVNRQKNEVSLCYPHFNDGLGVGDLLMLGWYSDKRNQRPVRIIGKRIGFGGTVYFQFEDALAEKKSTGLIQRFCNWKKVNKCQT